MMDRERVRDAAKRLAETMLDGDGDNPHSAYLLDELREALVDFADSIAGDAFTLRSAQVVYRATVEEVSAIGMRVDPLPMADGEESIAPCDGLGTVLLGFSNAPHGSSSVLARAFGSVFGLRGAVKITVEVDQAGAPAETKRDVAAPAAPAGHADHDEQEGEE